MIFSTSARFFAFLAALTILLTGCTAIPFLSTSVAATHTPAAVLPVTPTPEISPTPIPARPEKLVIWLPPQFDPAAGTPDGDLLQARLDEFETLYAIEIEVRIKSGTGATGVLETLSATNKAAPDALPDLIALPRDDMESAVLKGLLRPLDGLNAPLDDRDWYVFARQMARVQNSSYGIPFGADMLVLLYRPSAFGEPPTADWSLLAEQNALVAFPAASTRALFPLNLYLSAEGVLHDEKGRITLEEPALLEMLNFYAKHIDNQLFLHAVTQFQTEEQAWQAYQNGQANMVIAWASRFLQEKPTDTAMLPLPGIDQPPHTLATGWVWALAGASAERQILAVELARYLLDSQYLSEWTAQAGLLPPRPTAFSLWLPEMQNAINVEALETAHLMPNNEVLLVVGPVLQENLVMLLNNEQSVDEVLQSIMARLP